MEDVLTKYKRLDPVNHQYFVDYLRYLQLRNIRETTITTKLWKVYGYLIWSDFRDAKTAQPEELENFYLSRRKERSPITAFGDLQELTLFFRWLLPDRELVKFKPQKPRVDVPPEKVLQSDNIRGILEYCESQRDRALVAVVWDSACRISELLDTNIGHVTFDRYGAVISVSGKTGRRNIRLVSSVPDLQAWINIHPLKNNPDAPLFVTSRRRGNTSLSRLTVRRVQNIFARLGDLAGCAKDTNPHAFRHGRLTVRGRQLTESELREYAGWSKGSSMARVYVHLSSRDIDNKILAVDGVKPEEEPEADPMAAQICPRCKKSNAPDAMYCDRCSMALNDEAVKNIAVLQNINEDPDTHAEYAVWLKARKERLG
jgi:integrase/recombinase XerC